jgi:hypothetical protein
MEFRRTTSCSLLLAAVLGAACSSRHTAPAVPTPPPARVSEVDEVEPRASVVVVRITGQDWNWRAPWSKTGPWTRQVTGLVVAGRRILVASPHFGNHILIEVQKLGADERVPARLVVFDPEGPLGLLAVDDPAFWEGLAPMSFAAQVPVAGGIALNRWLRSGQFESAQASIRQVREARHGLSRTTLLSLDISSSMEGAGESEVATLDGKVVGLVTSKNSDSLLALAAPVLSQFLADAERTPYTGFARAGLSWQELTSPALREWLGLRPDEGGVRLTRVLPHGSGGGVLEPGDVLLTVDGVPIDRTGQILYKDYGRLLFAVLFSDGHRPGEAVPATILRGGERMTVSLTLRRMLPEQERVPPYLVGRGPDFVVRGGLVFQELTTPYISVGNGRRVPPRVLIAHDRDATDPSDDRQRIVLLSSVLPDQANLGYQDLKDLILSKVNGRKIGTLDDVRRAFAEPQGDAHVVEFLPGQGPERIVLDAAASAGAQERVRQLYGVEENPASGGASP